MGGRFTWFLLGAVVASAVWLVALRTLDQQLLQTFLGLK
jgi:arginine exporter protein ArgO